MNNMILSLVLFRIWFDMIFSGEKKEEYRDIKPYYCSKFLLFGGDHWKLDKWKWFFLHEPEPIKKLKYLIESGVVTYKHFNKVNFFHAYKKGRDQFIIGLDSIRIDTGKEEWGAEKGKEYFVLSLNKLHK